MDSQPARAWGLSAQLYALRRAGDGGSGDTQALEQLARAAAERGVDALAISPMHAMFSADTEHFSPYSPSSRLFLNSLYASPGCILGERALRSAIESTGLADELQELEQQSLIDWPAAAKAKQRLLRALYEDFRQGEHPQQADFISFRQAGGEALENHCRFEAVQAARAASSESLDWRQWPRTGATRAAPRWHTSPPNRPKPLVLCLQPMVDRPLPRARTTSRTRQWHGHRPDCRPGRGRRWRRQPGLEPSG